MSKYVLLILTAALSLSLVLSAEEPVVEDTPTSQGFDLGRTAPIHDLQPRRDATEALSIGVRDPFMIAAVNMPLENDAPDDSPPAAAPNIPAFPAFQVLGKQRDDKGWAVFMGEASGQGTVWVVRTGDSFDEHYRVAKLAPPVLVIRNSRNGKSKTYDIGKDEE